jgi:hypothetical protein
LVSSDAPEAQARLGIQVKERRCRIGYAPTERETVDAALRLKPLAIVTDNQKGRDNLSGLNMTWDICRLPELRETILFMLTEDRVEPAFLWNGGDWFIHKRGLPGAMLAKPIEEYLSA